MFRRRQPGPTSPSISASAMIQGPVLRRMSPSNIASPIISNWNWSARAARIWISTAATATGLFTAPARQKPSAYDPHRVAQAIGTRLTRTERRPHLLSGHRTNQAHLHTRPSADHRASISDPRIQANTYRLQLNALPTSLDHCTTVTTKPICNFNPRPLRKSITTDFEHKHRNQSFGARRPDQLHQN